MTNIHTTEITTTESLVPRSGALEEIKNQVDEIRELMTKIMKKGIHYGKIGAVGQPTLFKAGAEMLISYFGLTFRTLTDREENMPDKYRIRIKAQLYKNERLLGEAFGEASSQEEKFKWRKAICKEEYEATDDDLKRIVYKKMYGKIVQVMQVRVPTDDIANTVLKMAVKRAMVAVVRMVCGASEVWSEDFEDMPEEIVDSLTEKTYLDENDITMPQPKKQVEHSDPQQKKQVEEDQNPKKKGVITEKQRKRLFAIATSANMPTEHLKIAVKNLCGVDRTEDIKWGDYDTICSFAENYSANLEAGVFTRWAEQNNNAQPFG
jgi:hypothetical protein